MPMTHLVFVKGEYNTILLFIITNSFCFYTMKVLEMVESSQGQGQSMWLMSKMHQIKFKLLVIKWHT